MNKRTGYTLIELLIVLTVLSLGLGTLMLMLRQVTTNNAESHFYSMAEGLAQEKIEEMLAGGFAAAAIGSSTESSITGFSDYTRTTQAAYTSPGNLNGTSAGVTDYKRVIVSVESKSGVVPISAELTTLLTDV